MATNNYLITAYQKNNLANLFINELVSKPHYMFIGDHSSNGTISEITNSDRYVNFDTYRNMIAGKKISSSDINRVIRYIPYETNKVFDMYNNSDESLDKKDFYCIVDEGSYYHVYKCLDNNLDANSTIEPDFSHISGANVELYQTSDGYRWKYMYSVDETTANKFKSTKYFPVVSNTSTTAEALDRSIDIIKINTEGKGYDNYLSSSFIFNDIKIDGNSSIYRLSSSQAQIVNGFYSGCILYIKTGSEAGVVRTIDDYYCNSSGNYIILDSDLENITNGIEYDINPKIIIYGDGYQLSNANARALINVDSSNSIYKIEMLERGKGYSYASANVYANDVVSVIEQASVTPIISPVNGHGYCSLNELFSNSIAISVKFSNTESNTIISANYFKQIGIIKDPLFANVVFNVSNASGIYSANETLYKINPVKIATGSINTTSCNVSINADQYNSLDSALSGNNTLVFLRTADDSEFAIQTINSVVNSSLITLSTNGAFACSDVYIYIANSDANCVITSISNSSTFYCTNVSSKFTSDDVVIGSLNFSLSTINTISRNDISKEFSTFLNVKKYTIANTTGSFQENEIVYQNSSNTSNAYLYAIVNSQIYVSNQVGSFTVGDEIIGNTSEAIAQITNAYADELAFASGSLIYLENIESVPRETDETQKINIYLDF